MNSKQDIMAMDDILKLDFLKIEAKWFKSRPRLDQTRILRAIDNAASNQTGKTAGEAEKKRKPFYKKLNELGKLND